MEFKSQKINKKKNIPAKNQLFNQKKPSKKQTSYIKKVLIITGVILSLFASIYILYAYTPATTIISKKLLTTIGSNLKKDNQGYTNILAMGIGNPDHDGANLTDSIIIASIHEKNKNVILTSIPRDLYVNHENIIAQRINSVYQNSKYRLGETKAINITKQILNEFTGFPIHYSIIINFQSLIDIINTLDGITIYNEQAIYDPFYPGPKYTYQTFRLPQGFQTINGETALKYARSRQTTSDFDRSARQQEIIFAMKEKALQLNFLTNLEKLEEIFNTIEKNIVTDLTIREIASLAALSQDIQRQDINKVVFNNEFNTKGGFLFTPPRSQYMGASVLLPADKTYSQIHTFIQLHRLYPYTMKNPLQIDVINNTKIEGLARKTANILTRYGFSINQLKNAENNDVSYPETIIKSSFKQEHETIKAIQLLFPPITHFESIEYQMPDPDTDGAPANLQIYTGTDLSDLLKHYDVYSTIEPLLKQALLEESSFSEEQNQEETEAVSSN